jgi:hypothetical protein
MGTKMMKSDEHQGEPGATEMVDALNKTFGSHGKRASHAKGLSAQGVFEPSLQARAFSSSPIFSRASTWPPSVFRLRAEIRTSPTKLQRRGAWQFRSKARKPSGSLLS